MVDTNGHLYSELGELARSLDTMLRQLDDAGAPIATMSGQLPQAASHLEGLTKLTEEGTHEVRFYTFTELKRMFHAAGLRVVGTSGGFDGQEFSLESKR